MGVEFYTLILGGWGLEVMGLNLIGCLIW